MDDEKKARPVVIIGHGGFSQRNLMLAAALAAVQHKVVMVDIEPEPLPYVEYKGHGKGDKKKARAALRRQWGIK